MKFPKMVRTLSAVAATSALLALGSCGGGKTTVPGSDACDVGSQNTWLRSYMLDWYFWSGSSPNPDPFGFDTVQKYFEALLSTGVDGVPADRWSYISETAGYNQYFEEGKTLGYGVSVNGLELRLPLKIRFVEAQSPASILGLRRGDVILAVNGQSSTDMIAANDFTALSPTREGETLRVEIAGDTGPRILTLTAATYSLTPVPVSRVLTLANGTKAGYLVMKDFITQAEAPLAKAFTDFLNAGATELILDLRYNGGGRISTANVLASLVAGRTHDGKLFTSLRYNTQQSSRNVTSYSLASSTTGFARVVVLTGVRTCSASELLVNGLKPYVEVVTVGGQTCGKPFGFIPATSCSSTFSAVNFESFNARGEGRYYDGLAASCTVSEDFSKQLGDPTETLTAAAASYLQTGSCPTAAEALVAPARASSILRRAVVRLAPDAGGEQRGMWAD